MKHLRQGQTRFWPFTDADGNPAVASALLKGGSAREGFFLQACFYPRDPVNLMLASEQELVVNTYPTRCAALRAISLGHYKLRTEPNY